jgi:peptidoglycan/xylan/chitin deacetylase (PgdA/CDA1 family)
VVRFHERADVRRACVDEVAAGGGVEFFRARGWERRLRRLLPARIEGRAETPEERAAALRRELGEARRLIAERIGQPALHLCYPWHAAGPDARRIAREAGYETAFWGKVPGVPITLAGGDLTRIARIGEDYMELLPGRGRLDLRTVLRRKWARRLRGK